MSSATFKIFQKFLINVQTAFKNLWKLRNILFSEQIVQSNGSIFFYLKDLLCCCESNTCHPLVIT